MAFREVKARVGRKADFDPKAEAVRRYQAGESMSQIAKALSVTNVTVCNWLHERGVAIRTAAVTVRARWAELEAFYRTHKRCPRDTNPEESGLRNFEGGRLKASPEQLHQLRARCGIVAAGDVGSKWEQLERFYRAHRRVPRYVVPAERMLANFEASATRRERARVATLRAECGVALRKPGPKKAARR